MPRIHAGVLVREYASTQTLVIYQWAGPSVVAQLAPDSRGKITGRKERKKKIQLHLWDSNPQPLAYMDKGTTTCAMGSLK